MKKTQNFSKELFIFGFIIILFLLLISILYYNVTKDIITLEDDIQPLFNEFEKKIPDDLISDPSKIKMSYIVWLYFENNSENSQWFSNFNSDKYILQLNNKKFIVYQPYNNTLKIVFNLKEIRTNPFVKDVVINPSNDPNCAVGTTAITSEEECKDAARNMNGYNYEFPLAASDWHVGCFAMVDVDEGKKEKHRGFYFGSKTEDTGEELAENYRLVCQREGTQFNYKYTEQEIEVNNIKLQKWIQIAVVLDNRNVDIYMDGILVKSDLLKNVPIIKSRNIIIGKSKHNPNCFLGKLQYKPDTTNLNELNGLYTKDKNSFSINSTIRNKVILDAIEIRKEQFKKKKLKTLEDYYNELPPSK
tara:strand:- start:934 stop:2013 length:1080 start_codon:yes stop_codon:yes gene_type:complete